MDDNLVYVYQLSGENTSLHKFRIMAPLFNGEAYCEVFLKEKFGDTKISWHFMDSYKVDHNIISSTKI